MRSGYLLNSSVGEYRLVDFLGAGGMGEVYRGVHSKIGRVVAVKVLTHASNVPGLMERFVNEARIQASLHHQNIATLYDFLEVDGRPCIIMELVDGQGLDERMKMAGILPLAEAVFIFQAVVEAVGYVHSHGIIHRDIKSNNIKINSAGEVKLLDFGIAKGGSTPNLTVTGDVVGTLHYLSPEQLKGGFADARSDIWALGVLLYEMVTGKVPFEEPTIGGLCEKIMKGTYTPPAIFNPSVPREVDAIIGRCLKRNPAERYASTKDLLRDLAPVVRMFSAPRLSSVDHKRSGQSGGVGDWARRNVAVLAVAAAALLVFIVAIVYFAVNSGPDSGTTVVSPSPSPLISPTPAPTAHAAQSPLAPGESKEVRIDVTEGHAEVFLGGQRVGTTPLKLNLKVGEKADLVLKQDGYHDKVAGQIVVGPLSDTKPYTYTMEKKPR
jgi:serine/threonine protein kinase